MMLLEKINDSQIGYGLKFASCIISYVIPLLIYYRSLLLFQGENKRIIPRLITSRIGLAISHLLYTNYSLVFYKASLKEALMVK